MKSASRQLVDFVPSAAISRTYQILHLEGSAQIYDKTERGVHR